MEEFDHGRHKSKHHHHRDRHHRHHHRHRKNSEDSGQESTVAAAPPPANPPPPVPPVKEKNFKLLVDPCLVKGAKKLYRIDGIVPGEPAWNVSSTKDPRQSIPRRWARTEAVDLPVPRFTIDSNYVGAPPEVEIIISNLNDNIDKQFLTDLVIKHGEVEEVTIHYHPVTRKHSGIARVVFVDVSSAHTCVATLNSKSVMGKQLVVDLDPFGKEWMKMIDQLLTPKKNFVPPPPEPDDDVARLGEKMKSLKSKPENDVNNSEEQPGSSPFSHKTPACNPSPVPAAPCAATSTSAAMPAYLQPPIPNDVALPDFNRPPPSVARPSWPVHGDWMNPGTQWQQPSWSTAAPSFLSPPPTLPAPAVPTESEKESKLDLDTRIELLLKGGINGMAPPFLALDMNDEAVPPVEEKLKALPSRSTSVSSDERYSPPPLPPGVDLSPTHTPPIPFLADTSSDRYLPLSTPPSPFISDEEYLECLLNWRLKHLSYVQLKEAEAKRRQKQLESDKVSEISSEEHEADFNGGKDDDRMSLSSLSSVTENIEEVTIPSNQYGSYYGEVAHHSYPHPDAKLAYHSDKWRDYSDADRMYHSFHVPYHPLHMPPMHHAPYHAYLPPEPEPAYEGDPLEYSVNLALEKVSELLKATLEKDLMKRMTEALAFNELEAWWGAEETRYKEERKEPEKDGAREETEEKKATTDALFNALIDSNYDGMSAGFSLGFRAALPKMPSFKKKRQPSPSRRDRDLKFTKEKYNESDEEEMVQLSDDESQGNDSEPETRKPRVSASEASDSESSESSETESQYAQSETEDEFAKMRDSYLAMVDNAALEAMREKTPEPCVTPVASEDFSDVEDGGKSPGGSSHLKQYAMEALVALGLDEFVSDVKITKGRARRPSMKAEAVPSTSKLIDSPVKKKPTPVKRRKNDGKVSDHVVKTPVKEEKLVKREEIDSEGTLSPPSHLISVEHSYSKPKPDRQETKPAIASWVLDHDYTSNVKPRADEEISVKSSVRERKKKSEKLVSHLLDSYLEKVPKRQPKRYAVRDAMQEAYKCFEFLTNGIDVEDIKYIKRGFDSLLADEAQAYWLQDMHWADHPATDIAGPSRYSKYSRGNETGCARTQGFYKLDPKEKLKMKHHYGKNKHNASSVQQAATEAKGWTAASREARSNQRRLLTAFGAVTDSDLLKFNQLKFRKKLLKFGKSEIHDWGLFALEPIAADEMVIEYVGQKVRPFLADYREKKYMKRGIGSSYLFRIDLEHIVDATHCGNLARFINHSCNPNCYAKIITIEGEKKIVIYSKRDIKVDEEITYDYKFPLEEEKIPCLCGDSLCKGFLN